LLMGLVHWLNVLLGEDNTSDRLRGLTYGSDIAMGTVFRV